MRSMSQGTMGRFFVIAATQGKRTLPVHIRYDKKIWSGLSWAGGEIRHGDMTPNQPIRLRLSSAETEKVRLDAWVFEVRY